MALLSRRMSSPACVPDWEREEGNLVHGARPCAVASSSQRTSSHVTMTCSFHQKIFERSKCSWRKRQQYPSGIFFNDQLSNRTSAQFFHGRKPGQCTQGFRSMDTVHCVHLVYSYLPLRVNTLHICFCFWVSFLLVLVLNPAVSRVTTLTSTVPSGLIPPLVLSTYSYDVYVHTCNHTPGQFKPWSHAGSPITACFSHSCLTFQLQNASLNIQAIYIIDI